MAEENLSVKIETDAKALEKFRNKLQEIAKTSEDIKKVSNAFSSIVAAVSAFSAGLNQSRGSLDSLNKAASLPNFSELKNVIEEQILPIISKLALGISAVAAAFTIITGPIGLTVTAILALGVAITLLLNNLDMSKYTIAAIVSGIKINFLQLVQQELANVKTNTLKEIELKQALLDVEKQINEDRKKDIDARISYEKAQFDEFNNKQKQDTLMLEQQQIKERLAASEKGSAEYYALRQREYENQKELNELGNYEFVSGWALAFEEIINQTTNWKEVFMGIYNELVSSISQTIQNLVDGQIDTWGKFGMAVTNIWRTLKDSIIKALTDIIAKELAAFAVEKTIALGKSVLNAIVGATDAGAKDPNPYTKVVTAAIVLAGLMAIANMAGAFEQGGIIGGNSWNGDNMIARVNSGEMILNKNQQANLWNLANGAGIESNGNAPITINQNIEITSSIGGLSSLTQAIRRGTLEALEFAGVTYNVGAKQSGVAL
ncbi:MAG: hypothetical protein LBD46_03395 [Endomicrobium sp.]|jgi:hypothetical protein|nr:hypothetical protein [Endomicrobium sp.]